MVILILSDLLLVTSSITAFDHAIAYAAGNLLFLIGVLTAGTLMLKGVFYRWVAYLSIISGIVGLASYIRQAASSVPASALLVLGIWSLAVGLNIRKLEK
jgi:hypothetical membrane protein